MLRLFQRYDIGRLHSYFQGDFDAGEKDGSTLEAKIFAPRQTHLSHLDSGRIAWTPLIRTEFRAIVDRVSARRSMSSAKKSHGKAHPCALELVAAPPKSCSILALAGPAVEERLVRLHGRAVDMTLERMREFLVTRRMNSQSFGVDVLRFPQFLNADLEPHLHDHTVFVWDAGEEKQGALHAYPIFFHLSAFGSLYHFALVALAKRLGYAVELEGPRWRMAGIKEQDVRAFSLRGETIEEIASEWADYESPGAAKHFASLGLRKVKPALPRISLLEARRGWLLIVPGERCAASRVQLAKGVLPLIEDMAPYFSASAVTTRTRLTGRILGDWTGKVLSVKKAWDYIQAAVDEAVGTGKLLAGKRNAVCHPRLFRVEQNILGMLRDGLGKGNACEITLPEGRITSRRLASAARRPDLVRIISQEDRDLEDEAALEILGGHSSCEEPHFERLEHWDAARVLRVLSANPARDVLVLVREAARAGDFVSLASRIASLPSADSLVRSRRLKLDGKPLEVTEGQLPRKVAGRFRVLQRGSREELRVIVVPSAYPEEPRLAWNDLLARRLFGLLAGPGDSSVLYYFDEVVPWSKVGDGYDWSSHALFCFRNNKLFRHGTRWTVVNFNREMLQLKAIQRMRTVKIEEVLAVKDTTALVMPTISRLTAGTQLESLLDFRKDGMRLRTGEAVLVSRVLEDKSIVLDGGRVVPSVFRAFRPTALVRRVVKSSRPPDVVVVADPPKTGILEHLRNFAFWRKMILLAERGKELRELIAVEIAAELHMEKNSQIARLLDAAEETEEHGVLPSRSSWVLDEEELTREAHGETAAEVERIPETENEETVPPDVAAEMLPPRSAPSSVALKVQESLAQEVPDAQEVPRPADVENIPEDVERNTAVKVSPDRTTKKDTGFPKMEVVPADAVAETLPASPDRSGLGTIAKGTLAEQPILSKKPKSTEEDKPKALQKIDSEQPPSQTQSAGKPTKK